MSFELLISTMHKNTGEVLEMLMQSNVKCDVLVVVQGNTEGYEEIQQNNQSIRVLFSKDRGLSKSRNLALQKSTADIVLLADDDLIYFDGFNDLIVKSFKENSSYQFLIFNVDNFDKTYPDKVRKVLWHHILGFASWQIAFRRKDVLGEGILLNENFGTGSGVYNSGEENIFLAKCYKHFNMLYIPEKILKRPKSESTWFTGYNDTFLFDRGAVFYAISPKFAYFLILQFTIRRKRLFPNYEYRKIISLMLDGMKNCKANMHYE